MQTTKRELTYEQKLDVLDLLRQATEPQRFTEIFQYLITQPKYQGKEKSVKTLLVNVLRTLEAEGLISRREKSHKNVTYSVRKEKKERVDRLLRAHSGTLDLLIQQVERKLMVGKSMEELNEYALFTFLVCLERYELELTEARKANDFDSFNEIRDDGSSYLKDFWITFVDNLHSLPVAETNAFYNRNEPSLESATSITPQVEIQRLNNARKILQSSLSRIDKGLENYSKLQKKINETETKTQKKE
jgi:DNA-binding HxlR family transcriptional regulator